MVKKKNLKNRFRTGSDDFGADTSRTTRTPGSWDRSTEASTAAAPPGTTSRTWSRTRDSTTTTGRCPRLRPPSPPRPRPRSPTARKVRADGEKKSRSKILTDFCCEKDSAPFPGLEKVDNSKKEKKKKFLKRVDKKTVLDFY